MEDQYLVCSHFPNIYILGIKILVFWVGKVGIYCDDITKELIGDNWLDWLYCMEKMVSHGNLFLRLLLGGMGVTGYINVNIHLTIICS